MKPQPTWTKNGYTLRLAQAADLDRYYHENYCPLDAEVARLTGSKRAFAKEEVAAFFLRAVEREDIFLFLLIAPNGSIIGEAVLNEWDRELNCANFRVAVFSAAERGKGLGGWAIETVRDFAFATLRLHRLTLDVFSFNLVAERAYLKAGFRREGVLRDAVLDGGVYADDILMSLLEEEWKRLKSAGR